MAMRVKVYEDDFEGRLSPALNANVVDGPWAKRDVSALGSPTLAAIDGAVNGSLTFDDGPQWLGFYHGDSLAFAFDDLIRADFWMAAPTIDANAELAFGLIGVQNDNVDEIDHAIIFRLMGNSNVLCETTDGLTDINAVGTGQTLDGSVRRFSMDFTALPAAIGPGVKTDTRSVSFAMDNDRGRFGPVAKGSHFNLSGLAGKKLQPWVQIQKTSGAAVSTFVFDRVRIEYRY